MCRTMETATFMSRVTVRSVRFIIAAGAAVTAVGVLMALLWWRDHRNPASGPPVGEDVRMSEASIGICVPVSSADPNVFYGAGLRVVGEEAVELVGVGFTGTGGARSGEVFIDPDGSVGVLSGWPPRDAPEVVAALDRGDFVEFPTRVEPNPPGQYTNIALHVVLPPAARVTDLHVTYRRVGDDQLMRSDASVSTLEGKTRC